MRALRDLLERLAERLWYGRRGLAFALWLPLLGPGTLVTWVLSRRRLGQRAAAKPGAVPVIGVGNLALGGTGKTQVVLALAERALALGRRVAVVTRGHGGSERGPILVPPDAAAAAFGDEPVLLQRRLPAAVVVVARDRAAGVALAAARGCDLVLLDDGLQQTSIAPARRLWVFGAESPIGNGALLPLGPLRDPIAAVRGEDVVWVQGEGSGGTLAHVEVRSRTVLAASSHAWRGRPVFAFAGIARPERFFRTLFEAGANVVGTARFADHRRFSEGDLQRLCSRAVALGAAGLVCTEKDAVRLPRTDLPLTIVALETRLEIVEGQATVEELLRKSS